MAQAQKQKVINLFSLLHDNRCSLHHWLCNGQWDCLLTKSPSTRPKTQFIFGDAYYARWTGHTETVMHGAIHDFVLFDNVVSNLVARSLLWGFTYIVSRAPRSISIYYRPWSGLKWRTSPSYQKGKFPIWAVVQLEIPTTQYYLVYGSRAEMVRRSNRATISILSLDQLVNSSYNDHIRTGTGQDWGRSPLGRLFRWSIWYNQFADVSPLAPTQ